MPLPKDYYTVSKALGLINKRTMSLSFAKTGIVSWSVGPDDDEDPLKNLVTALQDGQIKSWFVDETTGERVNLPSEVWWTVNQFGKSYLQFNATTGHVVMDLPSGGRGGGFLRIDKATFDLLIADTPSVALFNYHDKEQGRRQVSNDQSCEDWLSNLSFEYEIEKAAGRNPPRPKRDELKVKALDKFPGLSKRKFIGTWNRVAHDDWTTPGRRPKSEQ